jgi:drug/metabolite transporter (DMT)-like permease
MDSTTQKNISGWRRQLGGTSNYIVEYILMLMTYTAAIGSIIGMLFVLFELLADGSLNSIANGAGMASTISALVFVPLYWVLQKRVSAEEANKPEVSKHKARTVFLTFVSISALGWFTGFVVTALYFLISPVFSKVNSYGENFIGVFLPALFSATVIAFAYVQLHKHAGTRYRRLFLRVLLVATGLLVCVTLIVGAVKKNHKPSLKSGEKCTYSNYQKEKCTLDDYYKYMDDQNGGYNNRYDDYQYDNNLNNYYN